jgi:hypothetical protein
MNEDTQDKVLVIHALVMEITCSRKADAFSQYLGHVNALRVEAHPVDTEYVPDAIKPVEYLVNELHYLDTATPEELTGTIKQLEALK